MRILYVEDDYYTGKGLKKFLENRGFSVDWATTLEDGIWYAKNCTQDLVLLDKKLPDGDGSSILTLLREEGNGCPVIFLTGVADRQTIVKELSQGADDYISKPFDLEILLARIKAVLRRKGNLSSNSLKISDITICFNTRRVYYQKQDLFISPKEFQILEYLIQKQGRVVPRLELVEHMYDEEHEGTDSNSFNVLMCRLRKKLERSGHSFITTRRGEGYLLHFS